MLQTDESQEVRQPIAPPPKPDASATRIRMALLRNQRVLSHSPSVGRGTAKTSVRVVDGLTCMIQEGDWALTTDLTPKMGGNGAGPNPGILGRAALGGCLAMSYMMTAALLGITITAMSVDIETDYDTRGMLGFEGVTPAYEEVRCIVNIESPAPEEEIDRLLEEAERTSSYLHVFRDPQKVVREVRLKRTRGTAS